MRYLIKNLKPYWPVVILLVVLLAVQGFSEMSMPQYTQNIIDTGIQNRGVEHILPTKVKQQEYNEAQMFMTSAEKKAWKSAYQKEGNKYVRHASESRLDRLDDQLLEPIVLTYQLGHISPAQYKKMVRRQLKAAAAAQEKAMKKAASSGMSAGQIADMQKSAQAGAQAQSTSSLKTDPSALLKKLDSMSVKEIADAAGMDVRVFHAKNQNGKSKTYVDIRGAMQKMIDSGQMSSTQIHQMQKQIKKTIDTVGPKTLKSMGYRYAYDAEKDAGVHVNAVQISYLWSAGKKMFLMALLMLAAAVAVSYLASRVGAGVGRDLRDKVFRNVIGYSNAELDKFQTSSLITRATNDVQQVQQVTTMMLRMVLYAPVLGVWGIIKVYQTHANMSWVILLGVAVIIGFVLTLMAIAMPKFKIMQKLVDKLNGVSREILTGLMVIRAFGRQKTEEERFDQANVDLKRTQLFTNRVMTFMMPSMMLIMNALSILITWVASSRVDSGTLQVGAMTAFITYAMIIVSAFMIITAMSIILPRAGVAAQRIDEVATTVSSIQDKKNPEVLEGGKGEVVFSHVDFQYPGAEANVLSDIDFTAEPGKVTAIIGGTGSGKSTLINLIPRFYDVTGGKILVDGKDVRDVTMKSLRDEIGFVQQKGILFSGTIAGNIRFGNADASDEEVKRAAEIAQADDFIMDKEEKYDSYVSQGGNNVSGGQKQRLSIARAIAKKPKILIFDDSFSALDMKTDAKLREILEQEEHDTTRIIVAQRISTILHADQILVMDEGKIVGKGTHQQLMKSCDVYRQIAESQLSEKELEEMA
ncbi:MAG: ABC transporter ATP-binding protein/permease [Eubacterium sp.]|nr:ABC transporter ATP-binding protein/permease [Eubacterium sp.]MCH4047138.1 ABC transporter ATP-binding protein/permease [Eubacterium sp.]MCH4080235.1 ABC transporter ATP-binding protein/permease [Eubacterium sp.]MCH4111164.1 ABC transporter ATP-binding protein/permease [Eubacterium sp.]MCI1307796.1 ABC transporter ATP-binding protein/permease [Eubacterium sp.]